ncbi:hypothetical protein B0T11DRAFT_145199 [Plectosphaerella cucumerina]|jgi:hypothetical protein|uniref:Uncharacterized protein n=1 Tax=Plectosphaerella cucumerina TaxID=40658 RepID=A0A8K0T523_9PEZI|nr:hypothetical protein B0T11DRAFT_145199 [Plectosphaerella cucumerina]
MYYRRRGRFGSDRAGCLRRQPSSSDCAGWTGSVMLTSPPLPQATLASRDRPARGLALRHLQTTTSTEGGDGKGGRGKVVGRHFRCQSTCPSGLFSARALTLARQLVSLTDSHGRLWSSRWGDSAEHRLWLKQGSETIGQYYERSSLARIGAGRGVARWQRVKVGRGGVDAAGPPVVAGAAARGSPSPPPSFGIGGMVGSLWLRRRMPHAGKSTGLAESSAAEAGVNQEAGQQGRAGMEGRVGESGRLAGPRRFPRWPWPQVRDGTANGHDKLRVSPLSVRSGLTVVLVVVKLGAFLLAVDLTETPMQPRSCQTCISRLGLVCAANDLASARAHTPSPILRLQRGAVRRLKAMSGPL